MNGGLGAYDLRYEYDVGGNRTKETDAISGRLDMYTYDLRDPATYQSNNNRLMFVESFDTGGGGQDTFSKTYYYYYNDVGNVERILTKEENPAPGDSQFKAIRLHYAADGVAVAYILGERWDGDDVAGSCPTNYSVDYANEYDYDGPRQRWAVREIDLSTLNASDTNYGGVSEVFSEYDGDRIYNDFTINGGDVTVLRSYEPGVGNITNPLDPDPLNRVTKYNHPDKIGTTRIMSFPGGTATDASVYTAFGELIDGTNHRYGYVGSEGYQAHEQFLLLHVGARYYDPSIGRFVQRDPIGVRGGSNVYEYVFSQPTLRVDPRGLFTLGIGIGGTLDLGPFHLQVEISIHVGYSRKEGFSTGVSGTIGGGAGVGIGAGGGFVVTGTNADRVSDLAGGGYEIGVDTPFISCSGIQGASNNPDDYKPPYNGIQIGFGPPMPIAGIRAGDTQTGVIGG